MWVLTGPEYPAVASTLIQSAYRNTLDSAIATGLSNCITKDGQQTVTANIPFGGFKITGLGLATVATDAASIANLQAGTGQYVGTVGGTADVITLTPSPAITGYAAGQRFQFIASGANTTNVTVNISGLGAKAITLNGAVALTAGDIPSASLVTITYDGTRFQLNTVSGLGLPDGTVGAPGSHFSSDPDTGWYRSAANVMRLATGGVDAMILTTTEIAIGANHVIGAIDGVVGTPSYSFDSDLDTGWYRDTSNQVALSLGGVTAGQFAQGSFTGTLTGYASPPTGTVTWQRHGQIVFLYCTAQISGTSNAGTLTMTGIPAAIQPAGNYACLLSRILDNTATSLGSASVSGGTITFGIGVACTTNAFTSSGTKGLAAGFLCAYSLI